MGGCIKALMASAADILDGMVFSRSMLICVGSGGGGNSDMKDAVDSCRCGSSENVDIMAVLPNAVGEGNSTMGLDGVGISLALFKEVVFVICVGDGSCTMVG